MSETDVLASFFAVADRVIRRASKNGLPPGIGITFELVIGRPAIPASTYQVDVGLDTIVVMPAAGRYLSYDMCCGTHDMYDIRDNETFAQMLAHTLPLVHIITRDPSQRITTSRLYLPSTDGPLSALADLHNRVISEGSGSPHNVVVKIAPFDGQLSFSTEFHPVDDTPAPFIAIPIVGTSTGGRI